MTYNPLKDKHPYGATYVGGATKVTFPLDGSLKIKRVFIVLRQIFGEGGEINGDSFKFELPFKCTLGNEDIFEGEFSLGAYGIYKYRFEGEYENGSLAFFGRDENGDAILGDWLPEWQLTVSKCDYKTPNWAKQGVIYQIFADRFCRLGDTPFEKKGRLHTYWNDRPDIEEPFKDYRADDFFGGNAKGITSRLDYIKSLGVSCLYLSPIFKSSSNHRYDTGDYLQIDELFGSEEDFKNLVSKAKKKGIAVILDGVFNHTGADSKYFNREGNYPTLGAYQSKESPYYDWYYFNDYPTSYHCWWGSTVVPTVNKSASGFRELLLGKDGVIDKWAKFGIAGWRLDVVDELPVDFTTDLCRTIKDSGKDMLIVGEVWEDATVKIAYDEWRPYFMGEQLDSVMNYPFKEAILAYTLSGDKNAFISKVTGVLENYPRQNLDTLMNLIDSHDTVRALTYLSGVTPPESKRERADFKLNAEDYARAKARLKFASALQYTLPGVPCLYYGDEAGVQGFEDPLNRGTYPWGHEDKDIVEHYQALGRMREKYAELLQGETVFVKDDILLIFTRTSEAGTLTVYANATDKSVTRACTGKDALSGEYIDSMFVIEPGSVKIVANENFENKTLSALEADAVKGIAEAQFELGNRYMNGIDVEESWSTAFKLYMSSAQQDYAKAQYEVADCYFLGFGVDSDIAKAYEWYLKAGKQGYAQAQYDVAECLYFGQGVKTDKLEALDWYKKSAERGCAQAQVELGNQYWQGEILDKNCFEAEKWYKLASEQGNDVGMYNLGCLYMEENCFEHKRNECFDLFMKSSHDGSADALCNIGYCYNMGYGVDKDYKKANEYFLKSAEKGNETASFNLAENYELGNGVDANVNMAIKWYKVAAELGDDEAKEKLKALIKD